MYTETVFKFNVFFTTDFDADAQVRYVVAKNSDIARAKLENYYNIAESAGLAKPCFISDPVVEIETVV